MKTDDHARNNIPLNSPSFRGKQPPRVIENEQGTLSGLPSDFDLVTVIGSTRCIYIACFILNLVLVLLFSRRTFQIISNKRERGLKFTC